MKEFLRRLLPWNRVHTWGHVDRGGFCVRCRYPTSSCCFTCLFQPFLCCDCVKEHAPNVEFDGRIPDPHSSAYKEQKLDEREAKQRERDTNT